MNTYIEDGLEIEYDEGSVHFHVRWPMFDHGRRCLTPCIKIGNWCNEAHGRIVEGYGFDDMESAMSMAKAIMKMTTSIYSTGGLQKGDKWYLILREYDINEGVQHDHSKEWHDQDYTKVGWGYEKSV